MYPRTYPSKAKGPRPKNEDERTIERSQFLKRQILKPSQTNQKQHRLKR